MDRSPDSQIHASDSAHSDGKRPRDERAEWMAKLDHALDQLRGPQRAGSGASR